MIIRFSPHAIKRMKQRFPFTMDRIANVIERGIREDRWTFAACGRRKIEDFVAGERVRVVFEKGLMGQLTIVTVMWRDEPCT